MRETRGRESNMSDAALRRIAVLVTVLAASIASSVLHAQSVDPKTPAPLARGVNKGNVDNGVSGHYYYFWAGPGHFDVKMAFKDLGLWGKPLRQSLSFDFYNDQSELLAHNAIVSAATLQRIATVGDLDKRQKITLAVKPQAVPLRLGGYYEIEVTGAATFDGVEGATAGVTPKSSPSLIQNGGVQLVKPGTTLVGPGTPLTQPPAQPAAPTDPAAVSRQR
jgi:hypothetical protein